MSYLDPTDPSPMSAEDRLREVAAILAKDVLRPCTAAVRCARAATPILVLFHARNQPPIDLMCRPGWSTWDTVVNTLRTKEMSMSIAVN
ncbi:MAG TPA: hypothetical protein VGN72_10880 [Tepidisphaeraceae bacterium]|jgi:hypothetical protein|nr:hypothetical protein [Tepidisphaeraceae bacterium]